MQQASLTSSLVARRNPDRPFGLRFGSPKFDNCPKEALIESDSSNPTEFYSEVSMARHLLDCAVCGTWRERTCGLFSLILGEALIDLDLKSIANVWIHVLPGL